MTEQEVLTGLEYIGQRFRSHFTRDNVPQWQCGHCRTGFLYFKEETIQSYETPSSLSEHDDPYWEPSYVNGRFIAKFDCTRCNGVTLCIGRMGLDCVFTDDEGNYEHEFFYTPHLFEPSVPIFKIPEKCPANVTAAIQESFSVAWLDLSAAGNKLRIAIERLVLHLDPSLSQHGKLHKRLEVLENSKSHPEISDYLMAIKWLGNDASHEASLKEYDIAVAYQMLEATLSHLYAAKTDLSEFARLINSRKTSPAKA